MLQIDINDHRKSSTAELLAAVSAGDPFALAEAYHRTATAAHACARRLVSDRRDVEGLLRSAYLALWEETPEDVPLEAWVRYRVFVEGRAHLRETERSATSPSTSLLLRDAPMTDAPLDHTERLIAGLDDDALRALLLAHDRGIPTADQRSEAAAAGLRRALFALAEADDPGGCEDVPLADFSLGLLDDEDADRARSAVADSPECAEVLRTITRGRRRIEGLPPTPDLGHRVVAHVIATGAAAARAPVADTGPDPEPEPEPVFESEPPRASPHAAAPPAAPASPAEASAPSPAITPAGPPPSNGEEPSTADKTAEPAESALGEDAAVEERTSEESGEQAPSALDAMLTDLPSAPGIAAEGPGVEEAEPERLRPEGPGAQQGETGAVEGPGPSRSLPVEEESGATAVEEQPDRPAPIHVDSRDERTASWGTGAADGETGEDRLSFADEGFEEEPGRGRRALTVTLTVLAALLLLAAGAVAGLLLIRIFLG